MNKTNTVKDRLDYISRIYGVDKLYLLEILKGDTSFIDEEMFIKIVLGIVNYNMTYDKMSMYYDISLANLTPDTCTDRDMEQLQIACWRCIDNFPHFTSSDVFKKYASNITFNINAMTVAKVPDIVKVLDGTTLVDYCFPKIFLSFKETKEGDKSYNNDMHISDGYRDILKVFNARVAKGFVRSTPEAYYNMHDPSLDLYTAEGSTCNKKDDLYFRACESVFKVIGDYTDKNSPILSLLGDMTNKYAKYYTMMDITSFIDCYLYSVVFNYLLILDDIGIIKSGDNVSKYITEILEKVLPYTMAVDYKYTMRFGKVVSNSAGNVSAFIENMWDRESFYVNDDEFYENLSEFVEEEIGVQIMINRMKNR